MHRYFYLLVLLFAFLSWNVPFVTNQNVFSQSYSEQDEKEAKAEKERQKFVKEMQALLDAAQKSGFSEKQIREIMKIFITPTILCVIDNSDEICHL